jgi:hypothetical protein
MNFRKTIAALVILAVLGGVLYYLNKHPENKPSDTTTEKKKLFSFQPADVKEFTIEAQSTAQAAAPPTGGDTAKAATSASPTPPTLTVRRAADKGQWEIASPAGVPADSTQVQSFVDALSKYEYTPLEAQTPSSLAEYGLDPPQKTIQFSLNSGQTAKLSVGKDNPGGYAKYAMLSSTPGLFLLDSIDSKDLVDKSIFDLRDKRILPAAVDKAKKIELKFDLKAADPAEIEKAKKLGLPVKPAKIAMTHEANGNWQLSDPQVRTDFGDTNYFVTVVNGGTMSAVEDENPKSLAPFGLDRPAIRMEVTGEDGSTHTLLVGKKKTAKKPEEAKDDKKDAEKKEPPKTDENLGYYAKNLDHPAVFTINQQVYDQLNQDLDNYRNRFLFDFETSNARRVELQGPTGDLRLDKKGDDWFKGADGNQKADSSKVSTFLDAIHALRIQHFTEDRPGHLAEYGLDKPWMKVKVTFSESNKEETVLFGKKDKKFYAGRADSPSVYEMAPTEPEELEKKLKDLSS